MSLIEDAGDLEAIPIYSNSGGFEQDLWGNSTATTGSSASGVGFGMTVVNPNLGNGMGHQNPNTNATTMIYNHHNDQRNWVVVGVLVALIIMLWIILGGMLCYPLLRYIKRKWPVSERRINRRYDTIEGWLITKVVRPHDDSCEQLQKKVKETTKENQPTTTTIKAIATTSKPRCKENETTITDEEKQVEIKHRESYDTMETVLDESVDNDNDNDNEDGEYGSDDQECPICMEEFVVGDIVSWSSYERCSHVYHHQCIKEWLVSHNTCPFCRQVFLPVDKAHVKKITKEIFVELSKGRARRAERTFYCVQDGLVTLPETAASSSSSAATASVDGKAKSKLRRCSHIKQHDLKEKLKPGVTKADLRKLRGDRAEKICYGDTGGRLTIIENHHDFVDEDEGESSHHTHNNMPQDLEEPTGGPNDSLTTGESSDDEEEEDSKQQQQQQPQLHETSEKAESDLDFTSFSEEEGLELGLNGLVDETDSSNSSEPQYSLLEDEAMAAPSVGEAPVDDTAQLEKLEAGCLAENQTASSSSLSTTTTAIELALQEATTSSDVDSDDASKANHISILSVEQAIH